MKSLVLYFSCSGYTESVAKDIARKTNSDIFKIEPLVPYTEEDLNWHDENSRSSVEMRDHSSRPKIKSLLENMDEFDLIYLGFPIWWGVAPTVVNTFLEAHQLDNKTIVTFATSGGSSIGESTNELMNSAPNSKFINGKVIHIDDVDMFLDEVKNFIN